MPKDKKNIDTAFDDDNKQTNDDASEAVQDAAEGNEGTNTNND